MDLIEARAYTYPRFAACAATTIPTKARSACTALYEQRHLKLAASLKPTGSLST